MKGSSKRTAGLLRIIEKGRVYLKLFTHPDTPLYVKAILLGAVVYIVSPVDLIPDWILGFGIVDDLAISSLLVGIALKLIEKTQKNNEQQDSDER